MTPPAVLFRNRIAAFYWGFCAFFMAGVAAMTYVLARDGIPDDTPAPLAVGALAVFWIAGGGVSAHFASRPVVVLRAEPDGRLLLTLLRPYRTTRRVLAASDVRSAKVGHGTDSEGEAYFRCEVELADGLRFDLAEGHAREACEDALRRFEDAIRER